MWELNQLWRKATAHKIKKPDWFSSNWKNKEREKVDRRISIERFLTGDAELRSRSNWLEEGIFLDNIQATENMKALLRLPKKFRVYNILNSLHN